MPDGTAAPTTIQEARASGAVEGTMLSAPLAPATGPITVGVAPVVPATTETLPNGTILITPAQEPLVVVAVKRLWDSPTIQALRNAVLTACGLAVAVVALQIITANGDLWAINWQTTQKAAIAAAAFSLASGYAAIWKRKDNNAIQK